MFSFKFEVSHTGLIIHTKSHNTSKHLLRTIKKRPSFMWLDFYVWRKDRIHKIIPAKIRNHSDWFVYNKELVTHNSHAYSMACYVNVTRQYE